jgi:hypothetical protein
MKGAPTQLDMRENTASSRRHASRPAVDSPLAISERLPRAFQYRLQAHVSCGLAIPVLAPDASDPDRSMNTTPPEVATGEEREQGGETLPSRTAVTTAEGFRQMSELPEPFVSADEAAQFLSVKRRSTAIPRRYRRSICARHGTQTQNLGVSALGTCCFCRKE